MLTFGTTLHSMATRACSAGAILFLSLLPVMAQQPPQADVIRREMIAFRPDNRGFSEQRMRELRLPDGFTIDVVAKDLGHARMLAVGRDGTIYLTCPRQNRVLALRDGDGDGKAEQVRTVLDGLEQVHGITIHREYMYLAAPRKLWRVGMGQDGALGEPELLIDDLPDGGQHPNRTLGVGPDGKLYISVGSSCNACYEANPEHATILRADLNGRNREIFARGLRNTIGFDWHPRTGQLWGMDHGSDGRGNDVPPEELNRIEQGKHYGWPFAYGQRQVDPLIDDPPTGPSKEDAAADTEPAVLEYQAHSSPLGFVFYDARQFPARYRHGAFVPFRGSWNRYPATGYKVAFVRFDEQGRPIEFADFVTGFLIEDGRAHFARLAGIAVDTDGSLLLADDTNGVLYRVSYRGE